VLWQVPVRFWEDYQPERCVVVRDDGKYDFEDEYSTYAFHDGYGHDVYLSPDDLYPSLEECNAEILRRREVRSQERKRDVAKLSAAIEGIPPGEARVKAMLKPMQACWAEGDKRPKNRFRDTTRFVVAGAPTAKVVERDKKP
jgi:hypothetical protein